MGRLWGLTNAISHSVNVGNVVVIPRGDGSTSTLHAVIKFFETFCNEKRCLQKKP